MIARVSMIALFTCVVALSPLRASAKDDLIFNINTALKTRDGGGFARCFNFQDTDGATRDALIKIISQILAWPSFYVFVSDRAGEGNPRMQQGGKTFTLNGDWKYQVHIFLSKSSKQGFVFPAGGAAGNRDLILISVPLDAEKKAQPAATP